MTNLEFIKKEIYYYKDKYERELIVLDHFKEGTVQEEISRTKIKFYTERIRILKQIKTILEAWQAVEKHLEYFPSDFHNGIPEELITLTSKIDRKDYPKVKRALEVSNEKNK